MSVPQLTFVITAASLLVICTAVFYRGVRVHAASRRDTFLAAFMSALLVAVPAGVVAGFVTNLLG